MLDEGTARRTALQISDELAALGANLNTQSGLDVSSVNLSPYADLTGRSMFTPMSF